MATLIFENYELNYTYYRAKPDNPTVLFIHDLCMESAMWQPLLLGIERQFNILTYDFYSHGQSTDGEAALSLELLLKELTALLRHLHLHKVHVVGCRYSAIVAFELAIQAPESVASLTLMSMPFYVQSHSYAREAATNVQLLLLDHQLFEKRYMMQSVHPVSIAKSRTIIHALRSVADRHVISAIRELNSRIQTPDFNLIGKLKRLRIPALFMHGEYDPVYPAALAMIFSGYAPNHRFVLVPDASALIPLDQPKFALAAFKRFMDDKMYSNSLTPDGMKMINGLNAIVEKALKSQVVMHRSLQLSVLNGHTSVYWNGQELAGKWNKRNAQGLLLFIILNHGAVKRDMIIDAFTPDMAVSQARNHLRVQLSYLNNLFRNQPDPALHDLLMISRDSVALNARGESDIGIFIRNIENLQWSKKPADERSRIFLAYLEDYSPETLSTFNGDWSRQLESNLRNKLSRAMAQILLDLRNEKDHLRIRKVLKKGKIVEPYEGFCKSWMEALSGGK
ncbi:alpha/beta fold hydrolase [Sporolactobacillus pectinivorans]|uniref:alpha/beta fold hydrolase n=1 Tax=Sporolactobacillus pectinivorans TaxID=1591408 RepID=UPI000C260AB6|nr:alpha/beta hydrolase [Sporolactobacillus pectinivorans]